MQLKDRGIKVYVVTIDPSSDTPMALRVASEEGFVFRTNPFSGIEEIEPKITQAITKGTLSPSDAYIKMLFFFHHYSLIRLMISSFLLCRPSILPRRYY